MNTKCLFQSTEKLQQEFDDAKTGVDPAVLEKIMRGCLLDPSLENTERVRVLRQAWSRFRERLVHR